MIPWCAVVYDNIHWCMMVCNGFLGHFPLGDLQTKTLEIPLSLVDLGSMSGWMSLMESYIPQRFIFEWGITRVGI